MKDMLGIPAIKRDEFGKKRKTEESSSEEDVRKARKSEQSKRSRKAPLKNSSSSSASEDEDGRDDEDQGSGAEEEKESEENSKPPVADKKADTDDDLFQTPRFSKHGDSAPTPSENISDDLQEMLAQPMEENFKKTSDFQLIFIKNFVCQYEFVMGRPTCCDIECTLGCRVL